jgi:hypothetical protein
LLLLFGLFAAPAFPRKKEKEKPAAAFALIAGTTFRAPGFALPGSRVRVEPRAPESSGVRLKAVEVLTDSRGEFALRVPVVPMEWTVHVQVNGYHPQIRTVRVDGEQRVDLSFILEPVQPETKGGGGK